MENSYKTSNGNGKINHGHTIKKVLPLDWLDLRVFYVRVSRCEIDVSAPEHLTLNHIPLKPDTLLEVNGVRTGIYSDDFTSTLLRRDRLDKKTEEATYVSTDNIRVTGTMKFEVLDRDVLLISGVLDLRDGFNAGSSDHSQRWSMTCESDVKNSVVSESMSPVIEVYVAGSFSDATPIVLTKTLQLGSPRKKHVRIGGLDSIPEVSEYQKDVPDHIQIPEYHSNHKPEDNDYSNMYPQMECMEGELSWFNAGVRVGVGIGLSLSVGLGIGVGLLLRAYQGTTSNFRRRLL